MALQLGDMAPDFTAQTTEGTFGFHEWLGGSWCMLFSHPSAFHSVCTTELAVLSRLKPQFDKRNTKLLGLSVDELHNYFAWFKDIQELEGVTINYPMISDPERIIASMYGMIHPQDSQTFTIRSLYIINPDKKIKLIQMYPGSLGRNFHEILRTIDSLQLTASYEVATPAEWKKGDNCIILPSVPERELAGRFPKGYRQLKPYYRVTPQPDL
jgi:alkyl hydroperoxide reductase subunit AhpC